MVTYVDVEATWNAKCETTTTIINQSARKKKNVHANDGFTASGEVCFAWKWKWKWIHEIVVHKASEAAAVLSGHAFGIIENTLNAKTRSRAPNDIKRLGADTLVYHVACQTILWQNWRTHCYKRKNLLIHRSSTISSSKRKRYTTMHEFTHSLHLLLMRNT